MAQPVVTHPGSEFNQEISQAWREVELRVVQMAGGDASKLNKNLDIEGVIACLNETQAKNKNEAEKYGQIKNIFNQTLQCIQTVGGIVTTGVSAVFAPASTCYNALTFVIQAWQGYEGIFDSLASLLGKCIEFMDRLSIYTQASMDSKLTMVACLHLKIFVDICDRCLKLKQKRHKISAFMKQLFLNDDGVQGLLGTMNGLIDKERGLVAAQTWKSSLEAAEYSKDGLLLTRKMHDTLLEDKAQQMQDRDVESQRQSIITALDCDQDILDTKSAKPWDEVWNRYKAGILDGTGGWLFEDTRFTSWLKGAECSNRILGLQGDDGAGKTLLASNVVLNLRKGNIKVPEGVGSRIVVAHNFMDKDPRSTATHNGSEASAMSRNLVCQLVLDSESLMKSVAAICEDSKFLESPVEIWSKLLLNNEDITAMDITFVIIFDGILGNIQTFSHILSDISASPVSDCFRIIITGNSEFFHDLGQVRGAEIITIPLAQFNKSDVKLLIENRIDEMEILKEKKRPGVAEIRERILRELPDSTKGDYYKINRVLDNISKTDDPTEVDLQLQSAGNTRPEQIEADIQKLNQTLSSKEIAEVNEIILWTNNALWLIDAAMMEAAIELGIGGSASASLMSVRSKIKYKYTLFTVGWGGWVDYKVADIQDKIPLKQRRTKDSGQAMDDTQVSANEIDILRHYLSTVCPSSLYERVGFEAFFDSKLVPKGAQIYQDPDNAHIQLSLRCLKCLVEKRSEKTKLLYKYAQRLVIKHLNTVDLSLADRELKAEVGIMLTRLFTEQYAIASLLAFDIPSLFLYCSYIFHKGMTPKPWREWVFGQEGVECVSRWFKDSAVIELVRNTPLIKAFSEPNADAQSVLLMRGLETAASEIFRKDTARIETQTAFTFLYYLLTKKEPPLADSSYEFTRDMFDLVENWSKTALSYTTKDALWLARSAQAMIHLGLPFLGPAGGSNERAKEALELDPECWQASYVLSQGPFPEEEGINILQGVVDKLMNDTIWRSQPHNKTILIILLRDLGDRLMSPFSGIENSQEAAEKTFLKILEIDRSPEVLAGIAAVLDSFDDAKNWNAIVTLYSRLLEEPEEGVNTTGPFISRHMFSIQTPTVRAIQMTKRFDLLETLFSRAYASELEPFELYDLQYHHGMMLAEIGSGCEERALEILEEYFRVKPEGQGRFVDDTLVCLWSRLAYRESASPADAEFYHQKLQAYYEEHAASMPEDLQLRAFLVQYLNRRGEEQKAKALMKADVAEALEKLSSTDFYQDQSSLRTLNMVFCAMRDLRNSFVTWELNCLCCDAHETEKKRRDAIWKKKQDADQLGNSQVEEEKEQNGQANLEDEDEREQTDQEEVAGEQHNPEEVAESESQSDEDVHHSWGVESDDGIEDNWWDYGDRPSDDEISKETLLKHGFLAHCEVCYIVEINVRPMLLCLTQVGRHTVHDRCYNDMMEGKRPQFRCGRDHEFVKIPFRTLEKAKPLPRGCVVVEDEVIDYENWKAEIRAKYVDFE